MVLGFFAGTTVRQLAAKADKIERLRETLEEKKLQALADRYAAIKAAQDDIAAIQAL